jgi:hypothetical protein
MVAMFLMCVPRNVSIGKLPRKGQELVNISWRTSLDFPPASH